MPRLGSFVRHQFGSDTKHLALLFVVANYRSTVKTTHCRLSGDSRHQTSSTVPVVYVVVFESEFASCRLTAQTTVRFAHLFHPFHSVCSSAAASTFSLTSSNLPCSSGICSPCSSSTATFPFGNRNTVLTIIPCLSPYESCRSVPQALERRQETVGSVEYVAPSAEDHTWFPCS